MRSMDTGQVIASHVACTPTRILLIIILFRFRHQLQLEVWLESPYCFHEEHLGARPWYRAGDAYLTGTNADSSDVLGSSQVRLL